MLIYTTDDSFSTSVKNIQDAVKQLIYLLERCDLKTQLQTATVPPLYDEHGSPVMKVDLSPVTVPSNDKAEVLKAIETNLLPLERINSYEGNNRLFGWVEVKATEEVEKLLFDQFELIRTLKNHYRKLIDKHFKSESKRREFYRKHPVLKQFWIKTIERQINYSAFDIASTTFSWSPFAFSYHPFETVDDAVKYVEKSDCSVDVRENYIELLKKNDTPNIQYVVIKCSKIQPVQSVRWRDSSDAIKRKNLRAHSPLFVINKQVKKSGFVPKTSIDISVDNDERKPSKAADGDKTKTEKHTIIAPGVNIFYRSVHGHTGEHEKRKDFRRYVSN